MTETDNAASILKAFATDDLAGKLAALESDLHGCNKRTLSYALTGVNPDTHRAALTIKDLSRQVDVLVHATGILQRLPAILADGLADGETIEHLSLGAGVTKAEKSDSKPDLDFDLVTNKRVAEFKFARWQEKGPNGVRPRQLYADYVKLLTDTSGRDKYLYVVTRTPILQWLAGRSEWTKVLSKNPAAHERLRTFLAERGSELTTVGDIHREFGTIQIIDMDE